jgi:hypothetical protein
MPKRTNDFQQLIAQIMELLDDAVVEESREFPDPDTGQAREVDVYVLVRGKANGQEMRIAAECVDRSRKMDVGWVEAMYGKHSVLRVADVVLLVSASGFFRPAEIKARKRGMKAITPTITPKKLQRTLGLAGDYKMKMSVGVVDFENTQVTTAVVGTLVDEGGWFLRSDGTQCVEIGDFRLLTLIQHMGVDFTAGEPVPLKALEVVMPTMASESERAVSVAAPAHNGEPLYVRIVPADGGDPVLTPILLLTFVAKWSMSERADFEQTHMGEFDGIQIGTGSSTLDGKPARMVVTAGSDGSMKALAKVQYEVK